MIRFNYLKQEQFAAAWILGAVLLSTLSFGASEETPRLVFRSGFEAGTHIVSESAGPNRGRHRLAGVDHATGYDWRESLSRAGLTDDAFFQYVISSHEIPGDFVTTEVREMNGPSGQPTQVLYLGVKGDDPAAPALSRNEYDIHPKLAWRQGYARYAMFIHPDFLQKAPDDAWVMVMEWKEPRAPGVSTGGTNNWRANITLQRRSGAPFAWQFLRQEVQPTRQDEQKIVHATAPVPVGRWFTVETFWRWGRGGRIWFAVDGQTVFDEFGRFEHAINPLGLKFWALFKNYRGLNWYDADLSNGDETWFAYDDVEIWSDFPPAHPRSVSEPLHQENFDAQPETVWGALPAGWWLEGEASGARARVADGRLLVDAIADNVPGSTVWLDYELPGDVEVSFDVRVVEAKGAANNMNLLFQFRDLAGRNLRETSAERADGRYSHYHSARLSGTILTYLANGNPDEARARVRQVPPFDPTLHEFNGYHAKAGHTYHFQIIRRGAQLTWRIDGHTVAAIAVPPDATREPSGFLGFRTWQTLLWWDNLVVRRPVPEPETGHPTDAKAP
jgi:hypothetical protein